MIFYHTLCSLINLLNHGCFSLLVNFMLLMGVVVSSALSNSVKLAGGFINGCVFIEIWECEVLSKGGSS